MSSRIIKINFIHYRLSLIFYLNYHDDLDSFKMVYMRADPLGIENIEFDEYVSK